MWKTRGKREIMREMAIEQAVENKVGFPRFSNGAKQSTGAVERTMGIVGKSQRLELMFSVTSLIACETEGSVSSFSVTWSRE